MSMDDTIVSDSFRLECSGPRILTMPPFDLAPSPPPPTVGRVLSLPSAAAVARGVPAFYREETLFHWLPSPTLPGPPWMPAVIVAERAQMPETWCLKSNFRDGLPQALVVPIWQADLNSGDFECSWMLWLTWDAVFQLWRCLGIKILPIPPPSPAPARHPVFPRPPKERSFPSGRHPRRRPFLLVEPRLRTREATSVAVGVGASGRNAGTSCRRSWARSSPSASCSFAASACQR